MRIGKLFLATIAAMSFGTSAAASTILHGTNLSFHHEFFGNQIWAQNFTVGAGVEVEVGPNNPNAPRYYSIDIEDDTLTFQMGPYNFNSNFGFNGFVIRDVTDNAPSFLSLLSTTSTFSGTPGITITEDEIRFDFSTAGPTANGTAVFQFEIAPIPLTSSMAFLATGIGGLAFARRRKSIATAVTH